MRIRRKKLLWIDIAVLMSFILFAWLGNWSIIIGENLMKYDIWDAEYPLQVLMSDALASHTLPLWNPLMRFGMPNYAMAGTPVWYPFTMLLALFGYRPNTIAVSYAMHIAIGGFGMYLLTKREISAEKDENEIKYSEILVALIAGLLYCGSGLFLSNAEHIMIIISAAWLPYVFYYTKCYLEEGKLVYGMLAGACAAMILLGGYPEIFYNLFLAMAFYIFFLYYQNAYGIVRNVLKFIKKYLTICVCTILASAIMLIPFLVNLNLLTRTSGLGQTPETKPLMTILSFLLPGTAAYLPTGEVSMSNFYAGILTILLLPRILKTESKARKTYIFLILWSFILCWGRTSFLHGLLYRFFPMYSTFRFPTLNRALLTIFIILAIVPSINALMDGHISRRTITWEKILAAIVWTGALIGTFFCSFFTETSGINTDSLMKFVNAAFIAGLILMLWMFVFQLARDKKTSKNVVRGTIVGAVVLELLVYSSVEGPITATLYEPTAYARDLTVKNTIDNEFYLNENRDRDTNFSGQKRSTSGINSKNIVFNKTFDEEGYVSFRLQSIDSFLQTYNRSIIEQNPVAYFTNNVVTEQKVAYTDWVNSPIAPPEQVFAEKEVNVDENAVVRFKTEKLSEQELALQESGDGVILEGLNGLAAEPTGRIRLYYEQKNTESIPLEMTFVSEDGSEQSVSGDYQWNVEAERPYIDIYFPTVGKVYQGLKIKLNEVRPIAAAWVVMDRMPEDEYVNVYDFGFNSIGMNVTAPTEGYVTLLQTKHNGWTAYVDGVEQEISTIDGCFMGLYVEPGEHSIVMRFRPKEFFVGAFISIIYFGALGIMLIRCMLNSRKKKTAEV